MVDFNEQRSNILAGIASRVLSTGASEFVVEYEAGAERVFAMRGGAGVGIAEYRSNSDDARALRKQLYALRRKRQKLELGGTTYCLRVEVFDSFGEDAFRVTITTG